MSLDFDALFEGVSGGMTKEEAVYALLKIAMVIDGETDAREVAQLSAILKRSKTLLGAKDGAEQVIRKVDLLAKHECLNGAMVQLRAELHHQSLGSLSAQLHVERVARRHRAERQPGRAAVGLR